ncbi:MAG: AAA family ATPase [Candidatus Eisenbacteria bacterium]|nr:AAA family ATPase [Candidatus Eisenbacteria bacterium]
MTFPRYLEAPIRADLAGKMVLLAGPRQVGKTTLARRLLDEESVGAYFNWDNRLDRKEIRAARWPGGRALVVLDELHKWRSWKGWLKGEFDAHRERLRFLVTGSARMDTYRRGGDSLQGRYHHYRLHPLSVAELRSEGVADLPIPGGEIQVPLQGDAAVVQSMMAFSGFPEPFLAQSARTWRRWQKDRLDRFFREDVRDLESVRDLSSMQLLADMLPERVGSPLSLNALREDLEVSHRAVTHWVDILERLYHIFRLRPFVSKRAQGLRLMPKAYLWDSSLVSDAGPRFENLVALHLLKLCHLLEDREGIRAELSYLRDRTGREVDFLVSIDREPWFAVEARVSGVRIDPSLLYYRERLQIPYSYQVVLEGERDFVEEGVRCLPAARFLAALC